MTKKEYEVYIKLMPQLQSTYSEMSILSRKKPTETLNLFKLKFINSILNRANAILGDEYIPFPGEFENFDTDDLPNNGDVVLILSHYLTSLKSLKKANLSAAWPHNWMINGKESSYSS